MSIICYDSNGNALKRLYQWDINQTISISGLEASNAPAFHFCNKISSKALVVTPSATDDKIEVSVPNILLQQPYPIIAYLYEPVDEDGGRTMHTIQIPVFPRPKPEDYVYTETEVLNYKNLDSRVKALEQGGASAGDIAKAVEEYMTENPIEIPETLPNPHKLTLTGAVQAEYDGSEDVTVEIPTSGVSGEEVWETLADVTLEETSVPMIDIGEVCTNFRKMRFSVVLESMTPVAVNFVLSNKNTTVGGMSYIIFRSTQNIGNASSKYKVFIEFEPFIDEYISRTTATGGTIPGATTTINKFDYLYNTYDYDRLYNARYLYTSVELPVGTTIKITGVRV